MNFSYGQQRKKCRYFINIPKGKEDFIYSIALYFSKVRVSIKFHFTKNKNSNVHSFGLKIFYFGFWRDLDGMICSFLLRSPQSMIQRLLIQDRNYVRLRLRYRNYVSLGTALLLAGSKEMRCETCVFVVVATGIQMFFFFFT